MATHFVCQSTEPLAHRYPSGLGGKSHGAVSQYEVYNAAVKSHTRFPPPGWDFSQSSEDDSLPLLHAVPQPSQKNTSFLYDTDLCITPQKTKGPGVSAFSVEAEESDIFRKPDAKPDPDLTLTPMKAFDESLKPSFKTDCDKGKKQKVRFDLDSSVEQSLPDKLPQKSSPERAYKPELYNDENDEDFDVRKQETVISSEKSENARTVKYTVGKVNDKPVYVPIPSKEVADSAYFRCDTQSKNLQNKKPQNIPKAQTAGLKTVKVVREKPGTSSQVQIKAGTVKGDQPVQDSGKEPVDHIAACRVPEKGGPKRKAKVLRENQYTPKETEYSYPFKESGIEEYVGGEEHMFARPEYNSTLRMKLEAERLKEASVDIETALQRKLKMSESAKTEINEKASSLVNPAGAAFSGLVSLNVPVEELCKEATEIRTSRAKQFKPVKPKSKGHKEPDLLEFFSSDRQKESVTFSLPGISAPSEQLSTASHWRAFDLYKHNRVWDSAGKL